MKNTTMFRASKASPRNNNHETLEIAPAAMTRIANGVPASAKTSSRNIHVFPIFLTQACDLCEEGSGMWAVS
jgi:hypothetical protein